MIFLKHCLGIIFAFALLSCTSRTSLSDLKIDKETSFVYCDGKAFTGTAWSSDGKTISLSCHNGVVDSLTAYHANGVKAVQCITLWEAGSFYDAEGRPISDEDFVKLYPDLVEQIAALSYEIEGL